MAERDPGFYWVQLIQDDECWCVAEWGKSWGGDDDYFFWSLPGDAEVYQDCDFQQIGGRVERNVRELPLLPPPPEIKVSMPAVDVTLERLLELEENAHRLLQQAIDMSTAATREWPEPQPITDAQKTGERFLVWCTGGHKIIIHKDADGHHHVYGPMSLAPGWYSARWWSDPCGPGNSGGWQFGDHRISILDAGVTHYLPPPPDVTS